MNKAEYLVVMGGLFYVSVCPSAKPLAKKKG